METFSLGLDKLSYETLVSFGRNKDLKFKVSPDTEKKIKNSRKIIDKILGDEKSYYGINTGFGFLSNVKISSDKLVELQLNLIRSHACGVGDLVSEEIVRSLVFLRTHNFALGHSGVSRELISFMKECLEKDFTPLLYEQGSVGASGDLAPLAHLALGFIGEGKATYSGKILKASSAMSRLKLTPYSPKAKEGLSLINGTSFMAALASFALSEARILQISADIITALSLSAIKGSLSPFQKEVHEVRKQEGQRKVAHFISSLFDTKDEILESHKNCDRVQDPYSFRCAPQVHGATVDVIEFAETIVNRELSSVTDNPLVFSGGKIISGGNFHGQPLAYSMDFLAIAVSELGSISERRIDKMINPTMSPHPPFLIEGSGLNSGYMIPQVVAASLVSENKILSHPASVDSIPTSCDKEDHVSMGPIACHKARKINRNVANILAIELLAACQGIDLLKPLKPNKYLEPIYDKVRSISPYMKKDRSLSDDIKAVSELIQSGELIRLVNPIGISQHYDLPGIQKLFLRKNFVGKLNSH